MLPGELAKVEGALVCPTTVAWTTIGCAHPIVLVS